MADAPASRGARLLRLAHEHVSWERVLSGPGLYNVYLLLRDTGRGEEPAKGDGMIPDDGRQSRLREKG